MKRKMIIDGTEISDTTDCYVVAEIGHNHMGDIQIAKRMFKSAKECGADAVKLQKRDNRSLFTKELYNSYYSNENSYGATYGEHREALEFGREEYLELIRYAREIGITFFSTAFDFNSVDFLAELEMPAYKIASGDLNSTPLLKYIAEVGKPMILSTGGASLESVRRAYDIIMPINPQLCLLQCTAAYPVYNYEDMNLRVISTYLKEFPEVVAGLSDHESGITMATVAFVLGARIVEKHFTLNRSWKGTDHSFSLAPNGLRRLVRNLRRTKLALKEFKKNRLSCEEKPLLKMSKKLVAAKKLKKGTILKEKDLALKSPGDGLPPYEIENVIGMTLMKDLMVDENISYDFLK